MAVPHRPARFFYFGAIAPGGAGAQPRKKRNILTVGQSRHLTSGGTAVAQEKLLLKKQELANGNTETRGLGDGIHGFRRFHQIQMSAEPDSNSSHPRVAACSFPRPRVSASPLLRVPASPCPRVPASPPSYAQSFRERDMISRNPFLVLCLILIALNQSAFAQESAAPAAPSSSEVSRAQSKEDQNKSPIENAFKQLEWRSIGPANMG